MIALSRKFYGYARVSSQQQVISGLSLEAQQAQLLAHFTYLKSLPEYADLEWGGVFVDEAESAFKRPMFSRKHGSKIAMAAKAGDIVAVTKLDRAFRSVKDFVLVSELLATRGISLRLLDVGLDMATPIGRCTATILASFAELESAFKGERQKAANQAKIDRGLTSRVQRRFGEKKIYSSKGALLGYTIEKKEFAMLRLIWFLWMVKKYPRRRKPSWRELSAHVDAIYAKREKRDPINVESLRKYTGHALKLKFASIRRIAQRYGDIHPNNRSQIHHWFYQKCAERGFVRRVTVEE